MARLKPEQALDISTSDLAALLLQYIQRNQSTRRSSLPLAYPSNSVSSIVEHELTSGSDTDRSPLYARIPHAVAYLRENGLVTDDPSRRDDPDRVIPTAKGWATDVRIIAGAIEAFEYPSDGEAPRAWILAGLRTITGELAWALHADTHPDADQAIRIRFEVSSHEPVDEMRVLGSTKRLLSGTDWIDTNSTRWLIDLAKLRAAIPELGVVPWLTGKVAVTPQVSAGSHNRVIGFTGRYGYAQYSRVFVGTIELYVTPLSIQHLEASAVLPHVFVLESETDLVQGTAFHLKGVGLVTCEHVLGRDLILFRPDNVSRKLSVLVLARNATLDLARIDAAIPDLGDGLPLGSADNLAIGDQIWVCGFPNYNLGDSGILASGRVIGFRPSSGITRILVDAPIVAGNSGGPVLNAKGEVIGIAVTGAETFQQVQDTEKHGAVPVEALQYLSS
jgi:hypothetical protein